LNDRMVQSTNAADAATYAWIFNANESDPFMIASSDGQVVESIDVNHDTITLYDATTHPNKTITIASKLVVDVNGINSLSVNDTSKSIDITFDRPNVEAGKIEYYPDYVSGINWVLITSIDALQLFVAIEDDIMVSIIIAGIFAVIVTIVIINIHAWMDGQYALNSQTRAPPRQRSRKKLKEEITQIVKASANADWEKTHGGIGNSLVSMNEIAKFQSERAFKYIRFHSERYDSMYLIDQWSLEILKAWKQQRFVLIFTNRKYHIFMQYVIFAHIFSAIWEPITQDQLTQHGLNDQLCIFQIIVILLEWFDLIILYILRFIRFRARNVEYHQITKEWKVDTNLKANVKSAIFGGGKWKCLALTLINVCILGNYLTTVTNMRIGLFSYYIPILPILLIMRSTSLFRATQSFTRTIWHSKDVLILYMTTIFLFAALGMTIFMEELNENSWVASYSQVFLFVFLYFLFVFLYFSLRIDTHARGFCFLFFVFCFLFLFLFILVNKCVVDNLRAHNDGREL